MKVSKFAKTNLNILHWWPFFVIPLPVTVFAITFSIEERAGIVALICLCLYLIFCLGWFLYCKNHLVGQIIEFAAAFDATQKAQLDVLPLPYALVSSEGRVLWANASFKELTAGEKAHELSLSSIVPQAAEWDFGSEANAEWNFTYRNRQYTGELIRISKAELAAFAIKDISEITAAKEVIEGQKPVYGQVLIDNYEEVASSTEKLKKSLLSPVIERRVAKYFSEYGGLLHKLEPERFAITLDKKGLEKAMADGFTVLEKIQSTGCGNTVVPTLSIGIGADGADSAANYESARGALDLCLGRGGDQVVVRTPGGDKYYGAKSHSSDKVSGVKARVMAQSLREMISARDKVLIMGHKNPDADSLGSAVGIAHLAADLQKEVHIIEPENDAAIATMMRRLLEAGINFDRKLISVEDAMQQLDDNTLLIVVDTNNAKITEAPELYEAAQHVVNIDHHRRGNFKIENAELSFIEPHASSTSELTTAILNNIAGLSLLSDAEADALYAGIVVDTDNFLNMTGVRTFEAAAYLRRSGADVARVRKLLQDTMEDFQSRAKAINNVELFLGEFAFGICEEGTGNASITGAKIANELLKISGVKASFVFTKLAGEVNMSARSIDEVNVQLICERLGGGGHMTSAGAQLKGCTVADAISFVKETIKTMIKEGAL